MPIFHGAGGAGDSTNDAVVTEVANYASQAATSATNAATSATNSSTSASSASTSASNAAASASQAATSANNAASSVVAAQAQVSTATTKANEAAASAVTAATQASNSATSATAAANSADLADASASDAAASAAAALASAEDASDAVTDALSLYGDAQALADAVDDAETAATNAASSASAASGSATTATNAASTATTQATAANNSAISASSSAAAAFTQAGNAATSANSAAESAADALDAYNDTFAIYGSTAAVEAAVSNSQANRDAAAASATAASNSASASATSATASATSASAAATSAAQASAVALGNEPVRHSVRPSLLLDFANTKTLDPRITFTRASTGTFYDGKTVAKAEENLLVRSQEFDNASWGKNVAAIVATANTTTAPDGTSTADTLSETAVTQQFFVHTIGDSIISGLPYTFSVFVKAGTVGVVQLSFNGSVFGTGQYANFNVSTGVLGTVAGGTATITASTNGFYRCTFTATATSSGTNLNGALIAFCNNSTTASRLPSYAGNASSNLIVWGAQLEQRSSVTAYTATTTAPITNYIPALQTAAANVARFEHNPVTGESLGLEIEEQRTNLLTYSEQFDNAIWTKQNTAISANATISPDGTLTADKAAILASSAVTTSAYQAVSVSVGTFTNSVYVKAGGTQYVNVGFLYSAGIYSGTQFDITNGTIVRTASSTYTSPSATITPVGNGWYRCTHTTTVTTTTVYPLITASNALWTSGEPRQTLTGDGFSGIYIWGAQLEAGSFATSYIPTVASQVTRSADSASMTGTNFSSWYRADEGTWYGETPSIFRVNAAGYDYPRLLNNSATTATPLAVRFDGAGVAFNSTTIVATGNAVAAGTPIKLASSYSSAGFTANANAGTVATTTALMTVYSGIVLGRTNGSDNYINGCIRKIAYYPKRLTNAELQGLTTV